MLKWLCPQVIERYSSRAHAHMRKCLHILSLSLRSITPCTMSMHN